MYDLSRETRDNWEIPRREIQLTTQLGAGNFGEVWKGTVAYTVCLYYMQSRPWVMGHGSWVNQCEWVTWVTGQCSKTLDP